MKAPSKTHHNWMTAITFAEAGEWETAREMMPASRQRTNVNWLQSMFMAVAFAEAGLHDEALRFIETPQQKNHHTEGFLAAVGLRGVRVTYGVLAVEAV